MKAEIDQNRCAMCGSCVAICPEVFEMKEDGSVAPKGDGTIQDGDVEKAKEAQSACPAGAISISD